MADTKITQYTAVVTPIDTDLLETVQDLGTTPVNKKITWTVIKAFLKTYFDTLYGITKAAIEAVFTGDITTHTHNTLYAPIVTPASKMIISEYDYFRADFQGGMNAAALATGTLTTVVAEAMHPGIVSFACSASANSGYRYLGGLTSNLIAGGEEAIFIFQPKNLTNVSGYFGYHDSQTNAEPTDGVYLRLTGTTLSGKCRSNTTESVTGTTYTVSVNTWYKMKLAVNAAATLVTFTLYSEAGAVLWTDTVATNIPTGAGRQCTPNILVVNSAATDAKDMLWIDYHNFYGTKTLVR